MSGTRFDPPGPGSWMLDSAHCGQPRSRYTQTLVEQHAAPGFREGFARYGVLLDTIEFASVGPFPYVAPRPLGAPPDSRGTPPKWLFKLLMTLHPAIRRRVKRAGVVIRQKVWREDIDRFWRELPASEAATAALASEPIDTFTIEALVDHLKRLRAFADRRMFEHFRNAPTSMLPVGDFLAAASEWTAAPARDVVAALRGHSPASVAASRAMEHAADAIAGEAQARTLLASEEAPEKTIACLRALGGPVGDALAGLLDRYGDSIFSGHDVSERCLNELPGLVVAALRARLSARQDSAPQSEEAAASLRARVPEARRAMFDELLAEARAAYPLRDAQVSIDLWTFGVMRRSLLEAGRRLAGLGRLEREEHVFDADHEEILALLDGGSAPPAAEIAARARDRQASRLADAPLTLGPAPGEPPPAEWFPPDAARVIRAFAKYRELMDDPVHATDATVVRGVGASPGRSRGTARLVRSVDDFGRLRHGDILVATTTTPSYNVILPLLGGIVTDRGGLLSHPAIVSREYGFPGIVGARDATSRIPDGALIEIDGIAGTVTVLTA